VWSLPRGTPRDRAWWRFNVQNFAALVGFLEQTHPHGSYSGYVSGGGGQWAICREGGRVRVETHSNEGLLKGHPIWTVTGRQVRRHGVSEAFMTALVEMDAADGRSSLPRPRYLHTKIPTYCRHGHALTPANVYTMVRKRKGATHVERRCRTCNRARVQQYRRRA
jgi:hypothetical protein